MNGLNNSALYPYSLNNLQTINTSDGGTLPVLCDVPLIKTLTTSNQEISLYESSQDVIDFRYFDKSLNVSDLNAETMYATGARFFLLNATGATVDTLYASTSIYSNSSASFPNAQVDVYGLDINLNGIKSRGGYTGPWLYSQSGTFEYVLAKTGAFTNISCNSGVFNSISANSFTINSVNIPNITFTTATGTNLYSTMMSGSNSYFQRINSTTVGDCEFDNFRASAGVFTPYVYLQNGVISTTNNNSIEIVPGGNEVVYFRRGIADSANQITIDPNGGGLYAPTGYFTNCVIGNLDCSNANFTLMLTGATAYIQDAYIQNLYARNTIATGTFKGNFKVRNTDSIEFQASNGSQICQITPSATTTPPSLSYSTTALVGSQLQMTMTTSGTTLSQVNDISSQTAQVFTRADDKQLSINYVGSVSNDLTVNGKASIGYLTTAPTNGMIISGNTSIGTASNVNKLDVNGAVAIGSYAGVNTAPSNSLIISGNIGVSTGTTAQNLSVNGDGSINNGLWANRINIGGTLSTATKGFELDVKGYQRFYSHTNSNGFQLDIGSSGPYSNFRSGFFYKPDVSFSSDKTLYIVNADGANSSNTYLGSIQLAPNNASLGNLTCYGNGHTLITTNANDYCIKTLQNASNGYGLRVDCPYNGTYLAQFNGKIDSGSFETIMTLHAEGGNNGMLVLGAYPVAPSNVFKLWVAPPKNNSVQDTYVGITNQTFRANGTMYIGMSTGAVCDILTTTSNNHIDISPNGSQRTRFAGNGEIFLNGQSTSTSSVLNSTMTITSVSYYGGGGTSYYSTHGLGNYIPLVNIYHNAGFAIGAGTNLLASTEYYRTNHSAWIVAGGVQQLRCDWTGKYEILANLTVQMDTQYALAGYILYINGGGYTYQYQTNPVANGYVSMNVNQVIQLATGDTIQFYLYVSAGNAYVIGGSNVSMRYVG